MAHRVDDTAPTDAGTCHPDGLPKVTKLSPATSPYCHLDRL